MRRRLWTALWQWTLGFDEILHISWCNKMDSLPLWRMAADVADEGLWTAEPVERNSGIFFLRHTIQFANKFHLSELDWTGSLQLGLDISLITGVSCFIALFLSLESRVLRCTHIIASSPLGLTWRLVTHFSPSAVLRPTHYQRTWTVKASQCCHPLALHFQQSNEFSFRHFPYSAHTHTHIVCYSHWQPNIRKHALADFLYIFPA
jgi:hypothetical protein